MDTRPWMFLHPNIELLWHLGPLVLQARVGWLTVPRVALLHINTSCVKHSSGIHVEAFISACIFKHVLPDALTETNQMVLLIPDSGSILGPYTQQ
jgi:hypothetical protein